MGVGVWEKWKEGSIGHSLVEIASRRACVRDGDWDWLACHAIP